jgi:DNA polymerase III alpha subunit (gram-positive type)
MNVPSGFLGDQNDYSESMLLGQFPDNFDSDIGWNNDYSDFHSKNVRADPLMFNDNYLSSSQITTMSQLMQQGALRQNSLQAQQNVQQNILENSQQINQRNQQMQLLQLQQQQQQQQHQQQLQQQQQKQQQQSQQQQQQQQQLHQQQYQFQQHQQQQKVPDVILSSSQYNQQLHDMHLLHLEQVSNISKSSDYYNRPLDGVRSVLPIDEMNNEIGTYILNITHTHMLFHIR